MSRIDAEEIKKWYSVSPAKKEESACQNSHHRQNIHHKVDVEVARCILCIRDEHLSWMLRELPNSKSVKAHKDYWHVLTEPAEELQNPSAIPITMSHQQIHNLTDIFVFQPL
jgi:hypothetical protein